MASFRLSLNGLVFKHAANAVAAPCASLEASSATQARPRTSRSGRRRDTSSDTRLVTHVVTRGPTALAARPWCHKASSAAKQPSLPKEPRARAAATRPRALGPAGPTVLLLPTSSLQVLGTAGPAPAPSRAPSRAPSSLTGFAACSSSLRSRGTARGARSPVTSSAARASSAKRWASLSYCAAGRSTSAAARRPRTSPSHCCFCL